ncbi:RNA-dependent ATPase [Neophaeococcomyces mojaviensis]|uniref:RNA-dependent ATPase n=1 Tax=Neophaeococcomyces mojaviensis TaxID=3383035 RepID=A0ACC2ZRS3_9EURO|nr:RNA-dependent ATPase [Knufia sp. JES_112]
MSKHRLDDASALKHDKKRRKKDRKEALKYEDITPPSTDATANSTPAPEQQENGDATYKQNASLSSLPQADVDQFYKDESVQITDPQSSNLRPVLQFSHLPVELGASFSSFLSKFEKPSSIQSSAWPFLLSGRDVVGIAETGSGKTLAFGLPLVQRLTQLKKKKGIRAVVIAPTRELAIQVFEQIDLLSKASKLKAVCIYGGTNKDEQRRKVDGANIIVATPGRFKDFMSDATIDISKTRYLVLDEADRMLDKGFEDDIKHIISAMPSSSKRQTAMFTATWPKSIRELAATFMSSPVRITIGRAGPADPLDPDAQTHIDDGELRANPRIKQTVEVMDGTQKSSRLLQLLRQQNKEDRILVFCLYKKEATRIENLLRSNRFPVAGIHGDLAQAARERSLASFKSGESTVLVATDVAARGLDIPNVKLVINVTFPLTAEDYVHRIGRTGRAGKVGKAITFFTEQDKALAGGLVNVLKGAKQDVPEALLKFGTTVKKKQHDAYGAFFKESEDGKTATKITFDD